MDEREKLTEVDEELRQASVELVQASERYQRAILARIALRAALRQEGME